MNGNFKMSQHRSYINCATGIQIFGQLTVAQQLR